MTIPADFRADIEEGQRLRGWMTNAYAQIEFMLGDLILRCRVFPEYEALTKTFTHSAAKRAARVKRMASTNGPLDPFARDIVAIVDRFTDKQETRNLLAHGYCEYLYTPDGDAGLQFQKFHHQPGRDNARLIRTFRLADLHAETEIFTALSREAMPLFMRIHAHFGWAALSDKKIEETFNEPTTLARAPRNDV